MFLFIIIVFIDICFTFTNVGFFKIPTAISNKICFSILTGYKSSIQITEILFNSHSILVDESIMFYNFYTLHKSEVREL